jgi:ABC-type branched-subunit amino acid transport system ATPase component
MMAMTQESTQTPGSAPGSAIEISGIRKSFGGVAALDGIDLEIPRGALAGLIGPNGAGKTSLFNVITGLVQPDSGTVVADGNEVTGWPSHRIARSGIVRTFQTPRGFSSMTVLENMLVSEHTKAEAVGRGLLQGAGARGQSIDRATGVLEKLGIEHLSQTPYAELSGGELRLLEIGRHLMHEIKVLLLDEPTAGVSPSMQERLSEVVKELVASGITVVVVEHNLGFIFGLASEVTVMVNGRVLCTGTPTEVQAHPEVVAAYLGDT